MIDHHSLYALKETKENESLVFSRQSCVGSNETGCCFKRGLEMVLYLHRVCLMPLYTYCNIFGAVVHQKYNRTVVADGGLKCSSVNTFSLSVTA